MTELIQAQLYAVGLMFCSGLTAGIVYAFFCRLRERIHETYGPGTARKACLCSMLDGLLQIAGLFLIGYCTSMFFYYSDAGRITMQGIVSFFAGLWFWRELTDTEKGEKEHGKERKQTAGVREKPSGAGHHWRAGRKTEEKK